MTPRWTPEQLRSIRHVFLERSIDQPDPTLERDMAEICGQAADDAEAVARLTAENERLHIAVCRAAWERDEARAEVARLTAENARLASQNTAIYDQMERIQHQRDEARAIAQREKAYGDVAYKMGWVSPSEQRSRERDAATIAGWAKRAPGAEEAR